ncbi:phosphomevalonate kinase [Litchfieldella qijiaojingensis]|uniref:Phosphomevalonate kinase n=1 Tax=Litchfieldella qijiaojingensis TaxID=980347 RepID=A0ABQ2Z1U7_9GAMM|nr:hypothetical protein [Halomonas qijiaojingensis]GGY01671.1 phosphomevalonate kinase [Halomonas qijiaojingensis]
MRILASAPGKLVLFGEYAVLEGAPALVLAVDRRARVELDKGKDKDWTLISQPYLEREVHFTLDADNAVRWLDLSKAERSRLRYVQRLIEMLSKEAWFDAASERGSLMLDTRAFHEPGGVKLGLGSSAALTVALMAAAGATRENACQDRPLPQLPSLLSRHRSLQGGRGSGLDVAASLYGGAILYTLESHTQAMPRVIPVALPGSIRLLCLWSGRAASTGEFLTRLQAWREARPEVATWLMGRLEALARDGSCALEAGSPEELLRAMAEYGDGLRALGDASGLDIYSAEHRRLATLARQAGIVYKPSGAGGGDIGVAASNDPERLDYLRRLSESAGFLCLNLQPDSRGCEVRVEETSEGETHGTYITHS